ncbi:probable inactive allantoicase [Anopheles bellator]|uniref:probable inactive allantoicase n=1 Tax=Anopheles bellator TaxID=139047 RepID=UPI0026495655|nr:probable inactive allantoicase [Anopheles bellator]
MAASPAQEEKSTQTLAPDFTELSEVASIGSNGRVLFATDDWFAPAEWMLKDGEPVFLPDEYTAYGKWMDGWETRRKRLPGHDWCLIELGAPTRVAGLLIDTGFFTGNYAPRVSVQGGTLDETTRSMLETSITRRTEGDGMMGSGASADELGMVNLLGTDRWAVLLPRVELKPGYQATRRHYFALPDEKRQLVVRHLRVNMFPDGGIARLRVFGSVQLDRKLLRRSESSMAAKIDLIAMFNGGRCTEYSNAHYGHPRNLIKPSDGRNMGDGWETARRLDRPAVLMVDENGILQVPGCEWAIFALAAPGWIEEVHVDTKHFKGNYPDSVRLEYAVLDEPDCWIPLMEARKLSPDRMHVFRGAELLVQKRAAGTVRLTMAPDGGISRVRLMGTVAIESS